MSSEAVLQQLRQLCPEVQAAVVMDMDGAVSAISSSVAIEDIVGPVLTTFSTLSERTAQELGRGATNTVVLDGTQGLVVVHVLGDGRLLAAITGPNAR